MTMSTTPTPPLPPPEKPNPAVWWVLGILGAGIVVLVLAGVIVTAFVARQFRIRSSGNRVEIQTPAGELRVNKAGTHDTGLPVYPGAVASESSGGNVVFSTTDDKRVGIFAEHFQSSDSLEKVQAWYRNRLGPEFHQEGPDQKEASHKDRVDMGEHDLAFVDDTGDGARIVALKRISGGTEIDLVRVGKQEVQ